MTTLLIRGGRLIDPSQGKDGEADLWVEGNRVGALLRPGEKLPGQPDEVVDAEGMIVAPGFVDLHVHLREPGQTEKEDVESGTRAAVAGGFTSILCMPNTRPANDSVEVTELILRRAKEAGACRVYPVGAISRGLAGKELAPMRELKRAGCVAFSDDGRPVNDPALLRRALEIGRELDVPLIAHCEELSLSNRSTIHDGETARRLGLTGIPISAETMDVARVVVLAAETGARVHLAHLSCKESVELLLGFKKKCATLSGEVAPHHLALTDRAVEQHGTNAKMYPPLRREEDCAALASALRDGTIDAVATDHAPHTTEEKNRPFPKAPNGIIGLETALPVLLAVLGEGFPLTRLVDALSTAPARLAGIPGGSLKPGAPADLVIFSATEERTIGPDLFVSKSRNTPFLGFKGRGRVRRTYVGGRLAFEDSR